MGDFTAATGVAFCGSLLCRPSIMRCVRFREQADLCSSVICSTGNPFRLLSLPQDNANLGPIWRYRRRFWKITNFFWSKVFVVVSYASSRRDMSTTEKRR